MKKNPNGYSSKPHRFRENQIQIGRAVCEISVTNLQKSRQKWSQHCFNLITVFLVFLSFTERQC